VRIVFVLAQADTSGGVRTVATYARLLAQRGHEVLVVSAPAPVPSLKARVKSLLRGRGWPEGTGAAPSHLDGSGVEHRIIDRFRPVSDRDVPDADVVIATWWLTAEWVAALSARKGAKVHFLQGHESDLPGQPAERVADTWKLPFHRIVCSRWLLDLAREWYGDPAATCVPNGVDLEQFSAPPREKQQRPTVGLVYSDAQIKGCDVATAALELVARRRPDLRVVSFGSYPVNRSVPLPAHAEFTLRPSQREIPRLYASCDAWLWPSRREGFGLPILEAMACRTPVVAAPAGAAPEILQGGGGLLLPSSEVAPMADGIERLLAMPAARWRAMSEQARAVAVRHGWGESVNLFEATLQRAVATSSRRAPDFTTGVGGR
jgi:glycosyltransferase involved in cell wall biosynthesis